METDLQVKEATTLENSAKVESNEKLFGTMPINKLFIKCAIPSALAMFFSSIYMMADGMFVGHYVGSEALAAVNLIMPIIMIVFALADMIAIGSSVNISMYLGKGEEEKGNNLFTISLILIGLIGAVMSILGIFFLDDVIAIAIKEKELVNIAYNYAKPFMYVLFLIMPFFAVDNYLRVCGKEKLSMWINITISLLNIVLDWLFIVQFNLGIKGAAYATAISLCLGSIIIITLFSMKKFTLKFVKPQIDFKEIGRVVYNGSSEFFSNITGSIMSMIVNVVVLSVGGVIGVAAYSVVMYVSGIITPIIFAIVDSVQPAVSYNYGAKNKERILKIFKVSLIVSFIISVICFIAFILFPEQLASIFAEGNDVELIKMSKKAILIYAPAQLFIWFNIVVSMFMTSLDKPAYSLILMFSSSVAIPLVLILILVPIFGINGVFAVAVVTQIIGFILSLILWKKTIKSLNQ